MTIRQGFMKVVPHRVGLKFKASLGSITIFLKNSFQIFKARDDRLSTPTLQKVKILAHLERRQLVKSDFLNVF